MAPGKKKRKGRIVIGTVAVVVVCLMVAGSLFVLKVLLRDDSQRRKRQVQMVTLVKPPPPPKIKEKPPEPEIEKKEEIIEQEPEQPPPEQESAAEDNSPMDDDLGLDADGTAGADGFGLRGKKGGRALIGGGSGSRSLMQRYAWYTDILQEEIRKKVREHLEQNGGIPSGNLTAMVSLEIDDSGDIVAFDVYGSSGNHQMDRAVELALQVTRISEPPPLGMPKAMKLKITSKG